MAGLVAAARARELGAGVRLLEKGDRPGGSMLLSSGVVWRYRDFDEFRRQCPDGDAAAPAADLGAARRGARLAGRARRLAGSPHTTNPLTTGRRFDPGSLTGALVRAAGEVELGRSSPDGDGPLVVATGGYPVRLAGRRGLLVRSNPWSEGEGIDLALARGAAEAPSDEFYGRAMPGPVPEEHFVAASQLYGRFARRVNDLGEEFFPGEVSWSENDLAQAIAAQPGGRAWYELEAEALARPEVAEKLPYAQQTEPLRGRWPPRPRVRGGDAHLRRRASRHPGAGGRRRVGRGRRRRRRLERRLRERPGPGARPRPRRRRGCLSVAVELA